MPVLKNPKHELFAQEIAKGVTLESAYASAGYSPSRKNAQRLRTNEGVSRRIEEILSRAAQKAGVTVERVMAELAKIGFSDIRKAVQWGEGIAVRDADGNDTIANGVALIGSSEIDDDTAAAISEVALTREGIRIKFHDKRAALVDLGKHLGMFRDKVELSGPDGGPIETANVGARDRIATRLAAIRKPDAGQSG